MENKKSESQSMDGPQADLRQYLVAFRRRWPLMLVVFLAVFILAAAFILTQRPVGVPPQPGLFTAAATLSIPGPVSLPPAVAEAPFVHDPTLQRIAEISREPWSAQDLVISGSENCRLARESLRPDVREKASTCQVAAVYRDEKWLELHLAVTGPDQEVVRLYAHAIMSQYAESHQKARERAYRQALILACEIIESLRTESQAVLREAEQVTPHSSGAATRDVSAGDASLSSGGERAQDTAGLGSGNGEEQTSHLVLRFTELAMQFKLAAAAVEMAESIGRNRITCRDAVVTPAPVTDLRVIPKKSKLLLAFLVAALSAVVAGLVVDSLLTPRIGTRK